jgi:hypothetical protein
MKTHQKFNPENLNKIVINELQDEIFANLSFEDQKKAYESSSEAEEVYYGLDDVEQQDKMRNLHQAMMGALMLRGKAEDIKMKKEWSSIIKIYLAVFTAAMFITLWCNEWLFKLDKTTLNFLIAFGFAKVVGVVWLIVSHLFPKKNKLSNNHN